MKNSKTHPKTIKMNPALDLITKESIVIIKPDRRDDKERDEKYIVVEDNGDRILITPLFSKLSFPPYQTVLKSDVILSK